MKIIPIFNNRSNNSNNIRSNVSFSGNTKSITDVLNQLEIQRDIVTIKELNILHSDQFNSNIKQLCSELVDRIKKPLSEAEISQEINSAKFTQDEADEINSISNRIGFTVDEQTYKGDFARSLQTSLKIDAAELTPKDESNEFFKHCFTNLVTNIRMLQRTVGVPDNSHLKKLS